MTQKEKIRLLTKARKQIAAINKLRDYVYDMLIEKLEIGDQDSIVFDYVMNGYDPLLSRTANIVAKLI